jgi:hypothetical protein
VPKDLLSSPLANLVTEFWCRPVFGLRFYLSVASIVTGSGSCFFVLAVCNVRHLFTHSVLCVRCSRAVGFGFPVKIPAGDFCASNSVVGTHPARVLESSDQKIRIFLVLVMLL